MPYASYPDYLWCDSPVVLCGDYGYRHAAEGHQQSMGAITGGADTFLSKNKARSVDAFLARWTKVITIGFFLLVIAMNIFMFFAN